MQFVLYCLCGGVGVTADYLVYLLSSSFAHYQIANVLGYLSGTVVSFLLNRVITFKQRDKVGRRFAIFLGVAAVGFSVSALMLWGLVDHVGVNEQLAKLLTLPVVVVIQFLLNRRITFAIAASAP